MLRYPLVDLLRHLALLFCGRGDLRVQGIDAIHRPDDGLQRLTGLTNMLQVAGGQGRAALHRQNRITRTAL